MKTIILAGGLGTRLQSVVKDVPKPMADINGTPFLELLMENMAKYGATEFILCVSYKKEIIMDYFGTNFKNIPIKYSVEQQPLGTGGALKQAFELFDIDRALVINGDSFIQMDYRRFYEDFQNEYLALALKEVPDASRYGRVETQGQEITGFNEKSDVSQPGYINAGIYMINRRLWQDYSFENCFSFEKDVLETHIDKMHCKFMKTEDYFIDIGIPESYSKACKELKSIINPVAKALFLDRDGVINVDRHHLYKIEECQFVEGIFDLCRDARRKGYKLIVVTNQAGIAKGLYSEEDYHLLTKHIHEQFVRQGCPLDAEYYCPFHPQGQGCYCKVSPDRKPAPGMILRAAQEHCLDLPRSVLIGDKESDIEAGRAAGVGKTILLVNEEPDRAAIYSKADLKVKTLTEIKEI